MGRPSRKKARKAWKSRVVRRKSRERRGLMDVIRSLFGMK